MTADLGLSPDDDAPHAPRSLSRVLLDLAGRDAEHITLDEIAVELADRSFAALLILFSAPNLVPMPPGASTVFGIPLVLIAGQLLIGMPQVWLPRFLRLRSINRRKFSKAAHKLEPMLARLERLVRPRYWAMPRVVGERLVGFLALLMAISIALPIPFGNWLPALAIVVMSLGLTERDGLWLAAGAAFTVASLVVVFLIGAGAALAFLSIF
jgi:hypothetical protein